MTRIFLMLQYIYRLQAATKLYETLSTVFLILPPYALGGGILALTTNQVQSDILSEYGIDSYESPMSWHILGRNITALLCIAAACFLLKLFMEYKFFKSFSAGNEYHFEERLGEDSDVKDERARIKEDKNDILCIENLSKKYQKMCGRSHLAVNGVTVGVKSGEVFNYLPYRKIDTKERVKRFFARAVCQKFLTNLIWHSVSGGWA